MDLELRTMDLDGLPLLWADAPGPFAACLTFRVGLADETLPSLGVSHMVEHLAMFHLGERTLPHTASVDLTRTQFMSEGDPAEVVGFLRDTVLALAELPLDRLASERRVLLTEDAAGGWGIGSTILGWRCGPVGYGLASFRELGLHRVTPEEISAWAADRFTRDNAVLWMTGPPPTDLDVPLPPGTRRRLPAFEPLTAIRLPAYVSEGSGAVAVSVLGPRTAPFRATIDVLGRRLYKAIRVERGLSYNVGSWYQGLSEDVADGLFLADALPDHIDEVRDIMLAELAAVAEHGPTAGELDQLVDEVRRGEENPSMIVPHLDRAATAELTGEPAPGPGEYLALLREVTVDEARSTFAAGLEKAIVVVPDGHEVADARYVPFEHPEADPVVGRESAPHGIRPPRKPKLRVTYGPDGVTVRRDDDVATVRFEDCIAVVREGDGTHHLITRNGSSVTVRVNRLREGQQLASEIARRVPPERIVPIGAAGERWQDVEDLAAEKLARRSFVWSELELLPEKLEEDERPITMAEARDGLKVGLLTVTDRRVIFLCQGVREAPETSVAVSLPEITSVRSGPNLPGLVHEAVSFTTQAKRFRYTQIRPRERAKEIAEAIRLRSGAG